MENLSVYQKLIHHSTKLAVIGLGYVGMPIAVRFAQKGIQVIGFDINSEKVELYRHGSDPTGEIGGEEIRNTSVQFTSDESELHSAGFFIVAVPTPVNTDHTPDLDPVEKASELIGRNIEKGSVVCFESTVYPGITEEFCAPIIEKVSGMRCGTDWKIAYSPERINPGDRVHKLQNICKIISGMDDETLEEVRNVYNIVVEAGTYPVSNIRTAEAVKVVENSQRDINIAFMNELAMVFDRMGIDTNEVIDGMNTKWNALGFRPGLVGGHCIGVDPYYFTYEAEKLGYHSMIVLNGRIVNDGMARFVAEAAVRQVILAGKAVRNAKFVILGLTFKENCPDIRNSKVADMIQVLHEFDVEPVVVDPWVRKEDAQHEYGIRLTDMEDVRGADCIIIAVAHDVFKEMGTEDLDRLFRKSDNREKIIIDVKGILDPNILRREGYRFWRL